MINAMVMEHVLRHYHRDCRMMKWALLWEPKGGGSNIKTSSHQVLYLFWPLDGQIHCAAF